MEIYAGLGGFYAIPDIVRDFANEKARRAYKRELKKLKRQLRKLSSSRKYQKIRNLLALGSGACPNCGSRGLTRWGVYWRCVRYFFCQIVRRVPVPRFRCTHCGSTMSILPQSLTQQRRYSDKALRDMVDMKLWTYAGYRKVAKWGRIHGASHTTVLNEIIKLGNVCRSAIKSIVCKFSSIVCIDEVFFRKVKGVWYLGMAAIDARYGRVILEGTYYPNTPTAVKRFGDLVGENVLANKTECIEHFLNELLQIISPKVIITDELEAYSMIIDRINKRRKPDERIKHFLCTLHVQWNIEKAFQGFRNLPLSPRLKQMREQFMWIFEATTLDDANKRLDSVLARYYEFKGTPIQKAFDILRKNRDRLFPYLKYGLNRTNNPAEHYFGFVKRFQHVSRKFTSLRGLSSLLSAYALFYNFMPKMAGKNKGITPFQKAGWAHAMDMWTFINYPKCLHSNGDGVRTPLSSKVAHSEATALLA